MSQDSKIINCICCDYKTNKKYNLTRHMVRIHSQQNVTPPQQNVTPPQQNVTPLQQIVTPPQQNVTPLQQNVTPLQQNITPLQQKVWILQQNGSMSEQFVNNNQELEVSNEFRCKDCYRIFNKQWVLQRHIKICKGIINTLECMYCNHSFASRHSKSRHMKICKEKQYQEENSKIKPYIQNITNNNTTNNNNNTTNNNTTNNNTLNNTTNNNTLLNNTINVITYNPVYTELMPIVPKHVEKIKRMIKGSNTTNSKEIMRIIRQYADYSLDLYQNRFVIKNNLRSSYSRVHCGNNNWKHFVDSTILPQFTNSVVGSFQELFHE